MNNAVGSRLLAISFELLADCKKQMANSIFIMCTFLRLVSILRIEHQIKENITHQNTPDGHQHRTALQKIVRKTSNLCPIHHTEKHTEHNADDMKLVEILF